MNPYFTKDGKNQVAFLKLCPTPPASSSKSIHSMRMAPQEEIRSIRAETFPATKCSFLPPILCPWVPKQEGVEAEEPTFGFSQNKPRFQPLSLRHTNLEWIRAQASLPVSVFRMERMHSLLMPGLKNMGCNSEAALHSSIFEFNKSLNELLNSSPTFHLPQEVYPRKHQRVNYLILLKH